MTRTRYQKPAQTLHYVRYKVLESQPQTFTVKAYSNDDALAKMQAHLLSGDMLNAPAWHEVVIIGIYK